MIDLQQTYALDILSAVLGHGRMARLIQDLREQRGLVSYVSVRNMTQRLQGTFCISAQLPTENLAVVERAIAQHIHLLQTQSVTDAEIERIRTQIANRFIFGNESPCDRASLYGYYSSLVGDLTPALNYPARLHALDADDLQTAAQTYLSPDSYGIVIQRPAV